MFRPSDPTQILATFSKRGLELLDVDPLPLDPDQNGYARQHYLITYRKAVQPAQSTEALPTGRTTEMGTLNQKAPEDVGEIPLNSLTQEELEMLKQLPVESLTQEEADALQKLMSQEGETVRYDVD
jgi:hypothetical protein